MRVIDEKAISVKKLLSIYSNYKSEREYVVQIKLESKVAVLSPCLDKLVLTIRGNVN